MYMGNPDILRTFEFSVQKRILEFCNKINGTSADLYILMARKAACFVNALERASLLSIDGRVISERVLDCRIDWDDIESVIIIDDVIISGTTLYQTINDIKEKNPNISIKVIVLGLNSKWFNPHLLCNDQRETYIEPPIKILSNTECIRLSGDIVKMLSLIPLPYNIDYPIYNTLKLDDNAYAQMLSLPGWELAEASSLVQDNKNVFTYSFIPSPSILSNGGVFFNNQLIQNSLLKIRIYGRTNLGKRKGVHSVTIVPMAVLPPLKCDDVEKLFSLFSGIQKDALSAYLTTITSKLRFVQFAIADQLAKVFIREIDYLTDRETVIVRENETMRLLFPECIISNIISAADQNLFNLDYEYHDSVNEPKTFSHKYSQEDFIGINNTLISPFLDMYYNAEIPARRLALEFGPSVFCMKDYKKIISRLKQGYSLIDLENLLPTYSFEQKKRIVSAFLDKAVDNGIAVPITVLEEDTIYRAFRHGEDVQFGQREERLCMELFNAFNEEVSRKTWQKIWVEKLMVLFLKIGETKFLDPIQTDVSGYSSIASVRYYLQGPLVIKNTNQTYSDNPCLGYEDKAKWLSRDLLLSNKFPLKLESGMYVFDEDSFNEMNYTDHDQEIIIDPSLINEATAIGEVIGKLIDNSINKKLPCLNSDDLVALSCCIEPKDIIGALAAEINIAVKLFQDGFDHNAIEQLCVDIEFSDNTDVEKIKNIRSGYFFQSINDGIRKYKWFKTRYPQTIIERVKSQYRRRRDIVLWESLWSPNAGCNSENEIDLKILKFIDLEGLWLMCVKVYILILEYHFYFVHNDFAKANKIFIQLEAIEKELQAFPHNTNLLVQILPFIASFKKYRDEKFFNERVFGIVMGRLDSMMKRAFSIVENAGDNFKSFNHRPVIRYYQAALYVCVENPEYKSIVTDIFISVVFRMGKNADGVKPILTDMPTTKSLKHDENGVWYIGIGSGAEFWLLQFAVELMTRLRGKSNYKFVFFPYLCDSCKIKYIDGVKISCNNFKNLNQQLHEWIASIPMQTNTIYEVKEASIKKSIKDVNKKFKDVVEVEKEVIILDTPSPIEFSKTKYSINMAGLCKKQVNIGILTIVTEEAQAILNSFSDVETYHIDNRYFDEFNYRLSDDKCITGVHLQSADQGNTSIVSAFNALIRNYSCDYIILLGIAGSVKEEIDICDVYIGTGVLYYDRRKEKPDGSVEHRGMVFNNSFSFSQHLNRFFIRHSEPAVFESSFSDQSDVSFKVHRGLIGSGEAVIGNDLSPIKSWLQTVNSKVGVVETEAAGFFQAYYETGGNLINSDGLVTDIIAIRGISDKANKEKNDNYRLIASLNAVQCLKKLIDLLY